MAPPLTPLQAHLVSHYQEAALNWAAVAKELGLSLTETLLLVTLVTAPQSIAFNADDDAQIARGY
jgi:hypothetical protein